MMKKTIFCLAVLCLAALVSQIKGFEHEHEFTKNRVEHLHGFGKLKRPWFSGYANVDVRSSRKLFYVYTPYEGDDDAPVLLWLNGGPGCSSLMGLFTENGPVNVKFGGEKLEENPFSWTYLAHMIYLECPAGVGFGTSKNSDDYYTGDQHMAEDVVKFLEMFFREFYELRRMKFGISGESYGGHYVPTIVNLLDKKRSIHVPRVAWVIVGNGWTDPVLEAPEIIDTWWNRLMISKKTYHKIKERCSVSDITSWIINNVTAGGKSHFLRSFKNSAETEESRSPCFEALREGSMVEFGAVDILGTYLDVCVRGVDKLPLQPNPCSGQDLTKYLNTDQFQIDLGIEGKKPFKWEPCSSKLHYSAKDTERSVKQYYRKFIEDRKKILIYSGDNDAIVPSGGTRRWVEEFLGEDAPFKEWFALTNGRQVGGWLTKKRDFWFATVRDAGHMVPETQPHRMYTLLRMFLHDTDKSDDANPKKF